MNRALLESCLLPCSRLIVGTPQRITCTRSCLARCLSNCRTRYRNNPRALQLCLNNCRGLAAEMSTNRAFSARGHGVVAQRQLGGRPGLRLDRTVVTSSGKILHQEDKHIDLARYLLPNGQLNEIALRNRLTTIVEQIRRYQRRLPHGQNRVRLVVRVPNTTPRSQAQALQRFLLQALRPSRINVTEIGRAHV